MKQDTREFNNRQSAEDRKICNLLALEIDKGMPDAENKIWHAHPVWFLDENPVLGYRKLKDGRFYPMKGIVFAKYG